MMTRSFLSQQPALWRTMTILSCRSALCLTLLLTVSCVPHNTASLSELSQKYRPVAIATQVQTQPGGFAWSKDGKTLAWINDAVNLYDTGSASQRSIRIDGPRFVSWSPNDQLLVLAHDQGGSTLIETNKEGRLIRKTLVDADAIALYPSADNKSVFVLSQQVRPLSIGTEIAFSLRAYGRDGKITEPFYNFSRMYPIRDLDLRFHQAWVHAGLNPIDHSLLVIEHIKPPVIEPFSAVIAIDPCTKEASRFTDRNQLTLYASASWSPDGSNIALTSSTGRLEIRPLHGNAAVLDWAPVGFYPSWSPKGNRIYVGGSLLVLDEKKSEALLTHSPWSIAAWSPDGAKLAVATDGRLWLFNEFGSNATTTAELPGKARAEKMLQMQKLCDEGLVTQEEYRDQRSRIMTGSENK
jgi:hypothetical protein